MPSISNDPVRHIITFRVNHEEKRFLSELARESELSVSDYMRKILKTLKNKKELSNNLKY